MRLIVMGRIRELPMMVRYRVLKKITKQKKYNLYIRNNEKNSKVIKIKSKSCIHCIIMVYMDSTLLELQRTLHSIVQQIGYVSNQVLVIFEKEKCENTDLILYIDDLIKKGEIRFYTELGKERLQNNQYMTVIKCGDLLAPRYLYEMENRIGTSNAELIYADEDEINLKSMQRQNPYFKPDWSPDTLLSYNYIGNSTCIRADIVRSNGIELWNKDGCIPFANLKETFALWNYHYILTVTEVSKEISHIDKILYHRAYDTTQTAYDRVLLNEEMNDEIETEYLESLHHIKYNALIRRDVKGQIVYNQNNKLGNVVYEANDESISIIILTKDNNMIFEQCVNSILETTKNVRYEIIVVDNGSNIESKNRYQQFCEEHKIHYHWHPMKFNYSRLCNIGANYSKGDILLFLNDDTQIIQENWLTILAGQATRCNTALVGAKLLYPDRMTIQHCGIMNQNGNYTHAFYQIKQTEVGYHNLSNIVRNCFSVTGACLCITKQKFDYLGGWSEEFPVAYNDVEFGIRALKEGYVNVVRNDVVLLHYESLSRGADMNFKKMYRLGQERKKLVRMYQGIGNNDPYYNKNLSRYTIDYDINY